MTWRQTQVHFLDRQMLLHQLDQDAERLTVVLVDELGEHLRDRLDLLRGLI